MFPKPNCDFKKEKEKEVVMLLSVLSSVSPKLLLLDMSEFIHGGR